MAMTQIVRGRTDANVLTEPRAVWHVAVGRLKAGTPIATAEAERVLLDADLSRAKRKQVIDRQAAALILQAWLDANRARE